MSFRLAEQQGTRLLKPCNLIIDLVENLRGVHPEILTQVEDSFPLDANSKVGGDLVLRESGNLWIGVYRRVWP